MSLHWQSLRTRLVVGVLGAVVLSLWVASYAISRHLRQDMEAAISSQQFSTVSLIAAEIDRSLRERIGMLTEASRLIAANHPLTAANAPALLEKQAALLPLFNWGIVITDAQGLAIASLPKALDRVGTAYGDLPFIQEVLSSGKTLVSEPMLGRRTHAPVLTIAVPIKDSQGRLQGVILGVTNPAHANFLDEISTAKYGRTGDFLLTAPKSRVTIASSDKRRVMNPGPPLGLNPVYDRYIAGYDGSGVAVSSRGVEELSSSTRIATTGWLMQAVLPTEEAFAPIRAMQQRLIAISLLLSLLAGGIAWWWLRRQFKPLQEASRLLEQMRHGTIPRQALPVRRHDEIGQLAQAFNGLLGVIVAQEAQAAENAANRRLRKILSHVPGMVFQYVLHADGTGYFPFASDATRSIYGVSPAELAADAGKIRAMLHPDDVERFFLSMRVSKESLQPWQIDYRIRMSSGKLKWLRIDAVPERNDDGQITWYGFVTDISSTKAMESELRIAATTFESQEGIFITDADGVILRVNRAFSKITGYADTEAIGRTPSFLRSDRHDKDFYAKLWDTLIENGLWLGEIWNRRKNGDIYPEWITISAVRDTDGQTTNYVAAFTDITEHKQSEEIIHSLAFFDPLTNLPNRRRLMDRIRLAMVASQRSRQYGAVIFLDLDHFKVLNDTKGHDLGDELLKQVALRLTARVREGDTVARLGGDEFIVLLQDLGQESSEAASMAGMVAEKLRAAMNSPFDLGGYQYQSSTSSGVTLFLDEETGIDVLLKQADLALYQAKAAGRNTIRFFDPLMQQELDKRAAVEAGLREALTTDRLQLYYQPQMDAAGRLIGAEALLRWFDGAGNAIPSDEFMSLAEESGLILPLGEWILESACACLERWSQNACLAGIVLSVNISPRQFGQPDFVTLVETALARHHVAPHRLKLELTENVVFGNIDEVIARMKILKAHGVSFSLDDFGTGYSSLSYLKRLPIDQVKIDRGFVRNVVDDPDDAAIVEAIICLGRTLNLAVIAEGVETQEQRNFLAAHACLAYQGYLIGRPMTAADFEQFALKQSV
jgi:diguanylate cyclase (GGDEF)-like protein/PAS domain S-box-containing protein